MDDRTMTGSSTRRHGALAAMALATAVGTMGYTHEAGAQVLVGGYGPAPVYAAPAGPPAVPVSFQPDGEGSTVIASSPGTMPVSCAMPCTLPMAAGSLGFVQFTGAANFRATVGVPPTGATFRVRRRNTGLAVGGLVLGLVGTVLFGVAEIGALLVDYEPPAGLPLALLGLGGAVLAIPGYIMIGAAGRDRVDRVAHADGPRLLGFGVAPVAHGGASASVGIAF